jgi:hypothetical protein
MPYVSRLPSPVVRIPDHRLQVVLQPERFPPHSNQIEHGNAEREGEHRGDNLKRYAANL